MPQIVWRVPHAWPAVRRTCGGKGDCLSAQRLKRRQSTSLPAAHGLAQQRHAQQGRPRHTFIITSARNSACISHVPVEYTASTTEQRRSRAGVRTRRASRLAGSPEVSVRGSKCACWLLILAFVPPVAVPARVGTPCRERPALNGSAGAPHRTMIITGWRLHCIEATCAETAGYCCPAGGLPRACPCASRAPPRRRIASLITAG